MIFNSSFIIGLTLSSTLHSPLFVNSPSHFSTSMIFQRLTFKRFTSYAFYFGLPIQNLTIHKSHFEMFLKRPISIQQVDCTPIHNQVITNHNNAPCTTITYCTFQGITSNEIGGAFCISFNAEATSLFDHCTFTRCSTTTDGGALHFDIHDLSLNLLGNIIVTSSKFDSCTINSNNNSTVSGGAIYCKARSLDLSNTTFFNTGINSNSGICQGGAVYANILNADQIFCYNTFEGCFIQSTPESFGGAIYFLRDNIHSNVHLFSCVFENCNANNGSAFYSEQEINLIINATRFLDMQAYSIIYLNGEKENGFFIQTLGISNTKYDYFIYIKGLYNYMNKNDNSGLLYLDTSNNIGVDYYTDNFSNIPYDFTFVNFALYSNMPSFTYFIDSPILPSTVESPTDQYTPTPTDEHIQTSESITATSANVPSITSIIADITPSPETNESLINGAGTSNKGGLSAVAIIFIVIGCVIFVVGIIIAAVLLFRSRDGCYRNTCTGSDNYLGKRTSYF